MVMPADIQALARLVREMREAQRDYFRTRSREALQVSKSLEAKVDRALHEAEHQAVQGVQTDLFNGGK